MIGLLLYAILARASAALIAPGVHGLAEKNTGKAAATVMPPRDCKADAPERTPVPNCTARPTAAVPQINPDNPNTQTNNSEFARWAASF